LFVGLIEEFATLSRSTRWRGAGPTLVSNGIVIDVEHIQGVIKAAA
jgi:hypothetical protein